MYNVVSNPTLVFSGNFFHSFGDALLDFPGADNVPLGKLEIARNKVRCDCEQLKMLAAAVDHGHTELGARCGDRFFLKKRSSHKSIFEFQIKRLAEAAASSVRGNGLGARLFRKEFFDSGLCVDGEGEEERSLKGFLRERVRVEEGEKYFCFCV